MAWAVGLCRHLVPAHPASPEQIRGCAASLTAALRREALGGAQRLNNVNKMANEESPAQLAVFWLTWMGVPAWSRWVCGAGDIATPPPSALWFLSRPSRSYWEQRGGLHWQGKFPWEWKCPSSPGAPKRVCLSVPASPTPSHRVSGGTGGTQPAVVTG